MDTPAASPIKPPDYEYLGSKTLWMFILARSGPAAMFFLTFAALYGSIKSGFLQKIYPPLEPYFGLIALASFFIAVIVSAATFFIAWLVYINFRFLFGENAFKIKHGILDKEEIAIPYRQIQDVSIERDLSYQMLGLSKLVILTAGHEEAGESGESEGMLPAIDKNLAERLQSELLQRAEVQRVVTSTPEQ